MPVNSPNILIIGAGIAGLAMYRALQQHGITAQIIEKQSQWASVGTGIALPANAVAGFDRIGLRAALLQIAHPVTQVEYALADGTTLAKASLLEPPLNEQPFVALTRRELIALLATGVNAVRFNTTVRQLKMDSHGVNVALNSGSTERYDLVIAADGIHSATRAMVLPAVRPHDFGMTTWRFIMTGDTQSLHPIYYLGNDDAFMLYPIARDKIYCYAHLADPKAILQRRNPITVLRQHFANYTNAVTSALAHIDHEAEITVGRIESVDTDVAVAQRVVLIGDALHGCPPTLQQGTAQALADALALSSHLATQDIDTALRQYTHERLPQFRWVVKQSNQIMKLGKLGKYWLGRVLRNYKVRHQGPANVVGWRQLLRGEYF